MKSQSFSDKSPRISFGMMVLNGEPFVEAQLRALYPHAHQIIVAHGAMERSRINATPDGRSLDSTGETLKNFKDSSDPEDKLVIIEENGFYDGYDDMFSGKFADSITGDYLWQIDVDEFYHPEDIENVRKILTEDPSISGASVRWINFWGSFNYEADGWLRLAGGFDVHRILKWGPGYGYVGNTSGADSVSPAGKRASDGNWLSAECLAQEGIYCYHYAFVFPNQVFRKQAHYAGGGNINQASLRDQTDPNEPANYWATAVWQDLKDPFYIHNVPYHVSWLKRFKRTHPPEVAALYQKLVTRSSLNQLRKTEDLKNLVAAPKYQIAIILLRLLGWLHYQEHLPSRIRNIAARLAIIVEKKANPSPSIRLAPTPK